ncbi:signal recognition particle-docking protein FtsY [Sulfurovum sp.]|jgi:fused signal recognition particle receptor|uniref:signal recognition particle-docking protein FtsY n=1 Tax=Sulfurovum sp. TaxID=1969726 RepID=UPI002A368A7E|nr:signal recognition particle-docking protein FtsY [Sulfurovum sp.]MDD2452035.1 signal recognition particle-docking protein FtsY [Sulfurovum sp.]MDD3498771.1 signal recognition particle-docking protein FtsY [Sulfurovum sp.]MDY0402052.1 signal recognition particle-docking protein FtsY [Sulfurovum sp.]
MFNLFKKVLGKTSEAIKEVAPDRKKEISKDEFEEILLEADVNYELVERLLDELPEKINRIQAFNSLISVFQYKADWKESDASPFVEMIIGVNGAGKTTTISKLAYRYQEQGKSVILGAGDTFRAAAIEQLSRWADKLDVPIVSTKQGHDPSAVVYDTILSAKAKGIDHVIIDTAGRLHTQTNLSEELKKMIRVAGKAMEGAPHRKMLVLDGTQGSSSINQAKTFHEMIGIDGIIITKLDGTAKGGSVLSIADELKMPIWYIGTGEKPADMIRFKANEYVNTILDEIFL